MAKRRTKRDYDGRRDDAMIAGHNSLSSVDRVSLAAHSNGRQMLITISEALLEKVGWRVGDRVGFYFHTNNNDAFVTLARRSNGERKLCPYGGHSHGTGVIYMPATHDVFSYMRMYSGTRTMTYQVLDGGAIRISIPTKPRYRIPASSRRVASVTDAEDQDGRRKMIWRKIIDQAFADACWEPSAPAGGRNVVAFVSPCRRDVRRSAQDWLTSGGKSFQRICFLAGLHPADVRQKAVSYQIQGWRIHDGEAT